MNKGNEKATEAIIFGLAMVAIVLIIWSSFLNQGQQ